MRIMERWSGKKEDGMRMKMGRWNGKKEDGVRKMGRWSGTGRVE